MRPADSLQWFLPARNGRQNDRAGVEASTLASSRGIHKIISTSTKEVSSHGTLVAAV